MAEYLPIPIILGAVLLLWAIAARRSPFDAMLIGMAGLLLIFLVFREQLGSRLALQIGIWPEIALGLFGLLMLARVFLTRLGWPHRLGLGLAGCAVTLPLVLLIGIMALFAYGAGHDSHRPPTSNEVQSNRS